MTCITDETEISSILKNAAQIDDGLFSVVAQHRYIELYRVQTNDDRVFYVIDTRSTHHDEYITNLDDASTNAFVCDVEKRAFTDRREAYDWYFEFIDLETNF